MRRSRDAQEQGGAGVGMRSSGDAQEYGVLAFAFGGGKNVVVFFRPCPPLSRAYIYVGTKYLQPISLTEQERVL